MCSLPLSREVIGVVWQVHEQDTPPEGLDPAKLRNVIDRLHVPPLNDRLMDFVDWVAIEEDGQKRRYLPGP